METSARGNGGVVLALALIALAQSGCLDPHRRTPKPRKLETIFSPLDLPSPNSIRTAAGLPGPAYWQQRVDYEIEAVLDEPARRIQAQAKITYTNNSPNDLDILWLHLEQNLFKSTSDGALANPLSQGIVRLLLKQEDFSDFDGGFQIESIQAAGQELHLQVYDTVGRLELPEPIPARGGRVTLGLSWSFNIPASALALRMGVAEVEQGAIFQIAQWFPAVCVYDDVHGWNTLPYLGFGEFYTNFGSFDVKLTVPRDHLVVGTGVLQNPEEVLTAEQIDRLQTAQGSEQTMTIRGAEEVTDPASRPSGEGPLTWHFVAHDVRPFAWAGSPAFIWDAAGITRRGTPPSETAAGTPDMPQGTLVQSVYPKEALPLWETSTEILRSAIEEYSRRWFAYPYPVATSVNGAVGGMEYPMLVFCKERKDEQALYFVTIHEIGHTWFPMIVNTDERRYAWMDEGFNTFMNFYLVKERFPDDARIKGQLSLALLGLQFIAYQPIETPPDQNSPILLGLLQYVKTAMGLYALREGILGPERFDYAFKRYIDTWAYKSPQPADFFRCMENAAGKDLSWFWRGWFHETGNLDQAVECVFQWWGRGEVAVTFHNHGKMVMPVVYRVTYSDKSTEIRRLPVEAWFTTNRWTTRWAPGKKRVIEILIDPDNFFPDVNLWKNGWRSWW